MSCSFLIQAPMWSRCASWGCIVSLLCKKWPTPVIQDIGWARRRETWNSSLIHGGKATWEVWKIAWYVKERRQKNPISSNFSWWRRRNNTRSKKCSCAVFCLSAWRGDGFWSSGVRVWVWGPAPASSDRCGSDGRRKLHASVWFHSRTCVFQLDVGESCWSQRTRKSRRKTFVWNTDAKRTSFFKVSLLFPRAAG